MLKLLAALVVAVFAVLTTMDGVCCPDGCTNGQRSERPQGSAGMGTCMLCLGGIDASIRRLAAPSGALSLRLIGHAPLRIENITPAPLEHPPRR